MGAGYEAVTAGRSAWTATVLAAAGRSIERTRAEDLLDIPIRALAVWGVHWVNAGLGITYGASFNRHGDLFDRRGAEIGLRLRL